MKKNGMTLAELILVTAIIGVMITAGIMAFKVYDKGIKYICSNTYYALDRAVYNASNFWVNDQHKVFSDEITHSGTSDNGTENLCRGIIQYINPVENRDTTCSASKLVDISANDADFSNENVQFTATNGVRFWMTRRFPTKTKDVDNSNISSLKGLRFYIIFADMNGTKFPNSVTYERGNVNNGWKTKDPDIFAFAAFTKLTNGRESEARVIPIGIAEFEPRYLSARFRYWDIIDNSRVEMFSFPSRSIVGAKSEAWGYYGVNKDSDGKEAMNSDLVANECPLTYSDLIYHVLVNLEGISESKIYEFLGNRTYRQFINAIAQNPNLHDDTNVAIRQEDGNRITLRDNQPESHAQGTDNQGRYGCTTATADEDAENCEVFVDKYIY